MVYVTSSITGKSYLVRDLQTRQEAADTLALLELKIQAIGTAALASAANNSTSTMKSYMQRLQDRIPRIILTENSNDDNSTSYSINKGEQIVFCIRTKDKHQRIYDINLIFYVVLHELAHVACPIYDNHGPLFQEIFRYLTEQAIAHDLYHRIDFAKHPVNYCGLMLSSSIV